MPGDTVSGKPRCEEPGCGRITSAPCHIVGHPDYEHDYLETKHPGLNPVGRRARRWQASEEGKAYRAHTEELRKGETPCQINSPVCIGVAQHIHEDKARGKTGGIEAAIRKGATLWDACDPCNEYCSENQVWARERGFIFRARDIDREVRGL